MNDKFSHLSEREFKELLDKYYDPEKAFSVEEIVEEYRIDTIPSRLVSFFPPQFLEECCPYCADQHLILRAKSRAGYSSEIPYCPSCGHRGQIHCNCKNCKESRLSVARNMERQKRERILSAYEVPSLEMPNDDNLSFSSQLYLLALFSHSVSEDLKYAFPFQSGSAPMAPTQEYIRTICRELYAAEVIAPDPYSPIDAFVFDENTEAPAFYLSEVGWLFLPSQEASAKVDLMRRLKAKFDAVSPTEEWQSNAREIWQEIIYHEGVEYFRKRLAEYGMTAHEIGSKTQSVFLDLAQRFSIGQMYHILFIATRNSMDYANRKGLSVAHTMNLFPSGIERVANKYETEGWLREFKRDFDCPQSSLSAFFFDGILGLGDDYFSMRAQDWLDGQSSLAEEPSE